MWSVFSIALAASMVVGQTEGGSATPEDFAEYGDLMVGRWIGEVTLIADYPGIGKKGEKVIGHAVTRWISDRRGLEGEWFGGQGVGKSIAFWDPASKRIVQYAVDSGGTIARWQIWKEGDKWVFEGGETLPDGSKTEGKGATIVKDGGSTLVFEGTFTMNGKKTMDMHDVYRRASK